MFRWAVETGVWLWEGYEWTLTLADPRVADWPLMSSPKYTVAWTLGYLAMVALLPLAMRRRAPLELRGLLVLYNAAMVALNAYIFAQLLFHSLAAGYNWSCQPVEHSDDVHETAIAKALWWFYASKLFEFADTLFFILRGRMRQVSFLHVYHHSTMFCFWWIGIKWVAGGSAFLGALMNSAVHVLMYGYYALSAAFPKTNFWWKRYLTALQLLQFTVALTQAVRGVSTSPPCPFPQWMGYTLIAYMCSFLLLFGNFWLINYSKGPAAKPRAEEKPKTRKSREMGNGEAKRNGLDGSPYRRYPLRNGSNGTTQQ